MATRKLIVEVIGDSSSLERSFRRSSAAAGHFDRDLGRATRGALAGSGVFRSLGRSIAFASGGFLAFATAGQFIRTSIDAAKEAAVVQAQLAAQFKASGIALQPYQKQIDETTNRLSALAGFENDELKAGFTTVFRTTGDVSKSLRDLATVADLARAKHLALSQAALIVAKTEAGNTTLLRRQGFQIAQNATAEEALATLRRAVAGQARAGTTAQERFGAVLHETEQIIGKALLPTLTKYLERSTRWLQQMNESGKLQRDVAAATETLADAFGAARAVLGPLVEAFRNIGEAVGGTKNEFKILIGLWGAFKAQALIASLAGVASAFRGVAAAEGAAAAGMAGIGAGLGAGAVIGKAIGGFGLGAGGGLVAAGRNPLLTLLAQYAFSAASAIGTGDVKKIGGPLGVTLSRVPGGREALIDYIDPVDGKHRIIRAPSSGSIAKAIEADIQKRHHIGKAAPLGGAPRRGIDTPIRNFGGTPSPGVTKLPKGISLAGRFNILELRLAQAQVAGNIANQRSILLSEAKILKAEAAQAKTLKARTQFTQQLASLEDQIRGFNQKTTDATKKASDASKKRAEAARKAAAQARANLASFDVSLKLQVAQARLEALGKDPKPILQKIKQAAQAALKSGRLGLQGQLDAWNTIKSVNDQLQTAATKAVGEFRRSNFAQLIAGISLSGAEKKALEARLSQVGPGGTIPSRGFGVFGVPVAAGAAGTTVVHTSINLDGRQVAVNTTRHQQRRKIRNPDQRRGMFGGGGL